jgi:hypothetical protein
MIRGSWWMVRVLFVALAAHAALATEPTLRMESRAAPTEAEHPRLHSPDAAWLAQLPVAQTIRLAAPSEIELRGHEVSRSEPRRRVGFGRATDRIASTISAAHNESALRFAVTSPNAIHLRVAITFSDSAQYRITAYSPGEESHAVSLFRNAGNSFDHVQTIWTPITHGDVQMVVVERIDASAGRWSVSIPVISHFDRPLYPAGASPEFFGDAGACQVDIACVYQVAPLAMQPGMVDANFGIALAAFTKADGLSYTCTGTLLNSASYPSPLFLTAFHCLSDPQSISSLVTIWFYNRVACRSGGSNPSAVQLAGGATSVFGNGDLDAALVQLNQMPPPLATYLGWDATTMEPDTTILAIHHPKGDVKKASFGTEIEIVNTPVTVTDLETFPPGTFYSVSWQLGIIEPGSSGSPLLSFDSATGKFLLRGTATAGSQFTCSAGIEIAFYARFDNLYPHIQAALGPPPQNANNYQGLWWNAPAGSESGWGINLAHQGDIIFASWFTYDLAGKGLWLVMTAPKTALNIYSGALYQTTGPAFSAVPFNPSQVTPTQVGNGTLTFSDANTGSFTYTVNGIPGMKNITRQVFGPLPTCTSDAGNPAAATNYQDLWWAAPAGSESGWGVNFTHQGDTIFATWFTYDLDGTPMWLVATAPKTASATYSGALYRTTGPAFNAVPFNPASVVPTDVGTATLTFTDGNTGTFAYTVNGVSQAKAITRQVFQNPGTVCQ